MTYVDELHDEMMNSPGYRAARSNSELVYQLASVLIGARADAGLTQTELAERMGTTQSAVARLEGGRSNPSMKTLERYGEATGTRLKISFEPVGDARPIEYQDETFSDDVTGEESAEAERVVTAPVTT